MTTTEPAPEVSDETGTTSDVVVIEARLLRSEYEAMREVILETGLSPNDFVRRAIVDEAAILRSVGSERTTPIAVAPQGHSRFALRRR
jgi:hypothetical protein